MASTNAFLTLYSTVQTNGVGSTISTGYIPYVSTAGRPAFRNMLSLGLSTNQTYNNLSNGNYSNWINAAASLGLSTIKQVDMSSSGQYQLIIAGPSALLYLSSDSGLTWSTLGSSNGLPAITTAYTYGAISANGQYMVVCAYNGSIYVSSNYGTTFVNASLPSVGPTNWFQFENNTVDSAGSITPTVTGTMYYVPGKVGSYALNIVNPAGGTAVNYLRGSWAPPTNCSITGWACPQYTLGTTQAVISVYSGSILLFIDTSNQFNMYAPQTSGAVGSITCTSFRITANTWYHFAIIYQTYGACSLYINGNLQGTINNTSGFAGFGNTGLFALGTYDHITSQAYSGYIDDVRLYNYAILPSGVPPQNFNFAAISGNGQYMAVTSPGNLAYSSNYGQTWTTPYGLTTGGQMSGLSVSNTGQYLLAENGGSIVPQLTSLGGNTWSVNGVSWYSTGSTSQSPAYLSFNNSTGSVGWYSNYIYTAGAYTGSISTTIQSIGAISGEWLQIQCSVPLVMYSYSFASGGTVAFNPKNYYIVGSNDGTTWYPIQSNTTSTNPFTSTYVAASTYLFANYTGSQQMYGQVTSTYSTTSYSYSSSAYTYFRIITQTLFSTSGSGLAEIGQWYINFSGGVSYSTNYGTTWTNTGTIASIPTSPSAVSGNGQYTLTAVGTNGPTALVNSNYVVSPYATGSGCIAYYPLNDVSGSTSITESIGGYYASVGGSGTTFGNAGKVGTSMYLNGSGYLSLPSTLYTPWNNLTTGSIALWAYPTATSSLTQGILFNKIHNGTASYSTISLGTYNGNTGTAGKLYFALGASYWSAGCSSNTILALNTWYHIVVTFNGSVVQFYINGVLDNTYYCNWNLPNDTTVVMQVGAASGSNLFTGYLDDFSLWNIALSQSTITALYNLQSPTLTSINSAIVGTALSHTGQYQVLVTGGATNNVYYSTNYGQTFTGITVGSSLTLLGCTCSFDGSYITVYTTSAVYILDNNGSSNSVAIGYAAGNVNQGPNAISIGTYAGLTNQVANSIVLNATGSTMNANTAGLFVGPVQPYSAIGASTINLLGYGADNQIVTMVPQVMYIMGAYNVGSTGSVVNSQNGTFINGMWATIPIQTISVYGGTNLLSAASPYTGQSSFILPYVGIWKMDIAFTISRGCAAYIILLYNTAVTGGYLSQVMTSLGVANSAVTASVIFYNISTTTPWTMGFYSGDSGSTTITPTSFSMVLLRTP